MARRAPSLDRAFQITNVWLGDVEDRLLLEDRQHAWDALRAVLQVLRDRLPMEAVLGLSAQTPLVIRGVLLEGWRPREGPTSIRHPEAFAEAVSARLPHPFPVSGRDAVEAVLGMLAERLDGGEARKLLKHLPESLRTMWPTEAPVAVPADVPVIVRRARAASGPSVGMGLVGGAAVATGGLLLAVVVTGLARSASMDPVGVLPSVHVQMERLAVGLLIIGLATMAAFGMVAIFRRSR